jgi:predicted ATP-dependent serine protease
MRTLNKEHLPKPDNQDKLLVLLKNRFVLSDELVVLIVTNNKVVETYSSSYLLFSRRVYDVIVSIDRD